MSDKNIGAVIESDASPVSDEAVEAEPAILRIRRIDLEVNDPDISMCGCHCVSYCTCNCDRGGVVS